MLKVIALLHVDEEMLKRVNSDDNLEMALHGEMGTMILSGIALVDFKVVINSVKELDQYEGNKAVILKKSDPSVNAGLQTLELINLTKDELKQFSK